MHRAPASPHAAPPNRRNIGRQRGEHPAMRPTQDLTTSCSATHSRPAGSPECLLTAATTEFLLSSAWRFSVWMRFPFSLLLRQAASVSRAGLLPERVAHATSDRVWSRRG